MKHILETAALIGAMAAAAVSCSEKRENLVDDRRIVFSDGGIDVLTKAVKEVSQLNAFNVAAYHDGSLYFDDRAELDGDVYKPEMERYFPMQGALTFYASNGRLEKTDTCALIEFWNTSDYDLVAALEPGVGYRRTPVKLKFKHVLSQICVYTESRDEWMQCNVDSIKVTVPENGFYNFLTDKWELSEHTLTIPIGEGEWMSVIPAKLKINVKWNYFQNGKKMASYDRDVYVDMVQGKKTTITLGLPNNDLSALSFKTEISGWENSSMNLEVN